LGKSSRLGLHYPITCLRAARENAIFFGLSCCFRELSRRIRQAELEEAAISFFSDLFGGADNAANAQIAGINAGVQQATGNINQGNQALTTNYAAALQPQTQNFATATQGTTALGNALGLNGPAGTQSALTALQTTPGYQASLGAGNAGVAAAAAAGGTTGSGNELLALQKAAQNTAAGNYNNYVAQLDPYLNLANSSALGISNVDTGLGGALNANQNTLANLNYGAQTGIGNANASADLADQSLGLGLLGGGLTALTGGLGGGLLGGLGTLGAGLTGGGVGTFNGNFGSAPNFSLLTGSDVRLKEHIEPVGELYDGQQIYRYNYIGDLKPRIGLMAQEVAEDNPGAVGDIGLGFLGVDYGKATDRAAELARFLDAA
jgi:hypothetical protein